MTETTTPDLTTYSDDDLRAMHIHASDTALAMMEDLSGRPTWTAAYKADFAAAHALAEEAVAYGNELVRRIDARDLAAHACLTHGLTGCGCDDDH